jgi:hypothetical protein
MTIDDIVGRVSSILASAPYNLTLALEPFSLDLQPSQHLDEVFCVLAEADDVTAYLGYAQAQIDRLTIRLARKINSDPHAATSQLYVDVHSLASSIIRDGSGADYNAWVHGWAIPHPDDTDNFAVAEIEVLADYDRAL